MKKIVLLAVALLFVSSMVFAGPGGYMGLYTDVDHSVCEIYSAGMEIIEMWVWVLPPSIEAGDEYPGMMCTEFKLAYPPPADFIASTVTWNDPIISVKMGDLPSGLSACYVACQYGWTWICHQMCYVMATANGYVQIVPHPDTLPEPAIQIAQCTEGMPLMLISVINHLALNQPCVIGTEESSWGAIKSMME